MNWHEYDRDLFIRARSERKTLHVSLGRYLSSRTPLEVRFYARDFVGETLNDAFINVKIDVDERPELERLFTIAYEPVEQQGSVPTIEIYPATIFVDAQRLTMTAPCYYFGVDPYDEGSTRLMYASNEILNLHLLHGTIEANAGLTLLLETHRRGQLDVQTKHVHSYEALLKDAISMRQRAIEADAQRSVGSWTFICGLASQLFRLWFHSRKRSREDSKGLDMALIGLTRWVRDVMFDHVEGGFYTPLRLRGKFGTELSKSLELNAWALDLLLRAITISRDKLLTAVAQQTADFILDALQLDEGGFALGLYDPTNSTQFAWNRRTVRRALTEDEYLVIETLYGLDKKANWHGRWLLRRTGSWQSVVDRLFFSKANAESLLASGREKLKDLARSRDVAYQVDERCLTRPNAMAISALTFASKTLSEPRWAEAARRGLHWLFDRYAPTLDETLETAEIAGSSLIDYALLLRAALDALAYRWEPPFAARARQLIDLIKTRFWHDKTLSLNAVDSGGLLLAFPQDHVVGKLHPVDAVRRGLQLYATLYQDADVFVLLKSLFDKVETYGATPGLRMNPGSDFSLDFHYGETVAVLCGPIDACEAWRRELLQPYKPFRHVFYVPFGSSRDLPPCLPRMMGLDDRQRPMAYVMRGMEQLGPLDDLDEIKQAFDV